MALTAGEYAAGSTGPESDRTTMGVMSQTTCEFDGVIVACGDFSVRTGLCRTPYVVHRPGLGRDEATEMCVRLWAGMRDPL